MTAISSKANMNHHHHLLLLLQAPWRRLLLNTHLLHAGLALGSRALSTRWPPPSRVRPTMPGVVVMVPGNNRVTSSGDANDNSTRSDTTPPLSKRAFPASVHSSRGIHNAMANADVSISGAASNGSAAGSWVGHAGAAAFDLRSDTMTTPTPAMLRAIQTATLLDDVFEEDPTTRDLEAHVAALAGKEAGLLVLSGTMGNQLALRALLTQPPHGVLCDAQSHIIQYEAGGVASLSGAMITPATPRNKHHLTLADVQAHAILSDDVHACPTRVISLENSLHGLVTPLSETQRIAAFARAHGVRLHCDGARLWEAVASGAGSLAEYAACFDTLSLCFSKGLGAPIGSVLVGSRDVVRRARWVRKSIGGGLRQSGVVAAAARVAVDTTFGTGPHGEGGLLRASHATARRVAKLWSDLGGRLTLPVETNMCWLDLESLGCDAQRFEQLGREAGLKILGNRLITHYQIGEEAIQKLAGIFAQIARENTGGAEPGTGEHSNKTGIYGR